MWWLAAAVFVISIVEVSNCDFETNFYSPSFRYQRPQINNPDNNDWFNVFNISKYNSPLEDCY